MRLSAKTRSRLYSAFLALIYAGALVFALICLLPVVKANREDIGVLQEGRGLLGRWAPADTQTQAISLPTDALVKVKRAYVEEMQRSYKDERTYYAERDAALERTSLLRTDPDHAHWLEQDYAYLLGELGKLARRYGTVAEASLILAPGYSWAGEASPEVPRAGDYAAIVKRCCLADAIVRLLTAANVQCAVTKIEFHPSKAPKKPPPKENVRDYKALRYRIRPVTVEFSVRFSQLRRALEQILKAPSVRARAPVRIKAPKVEEQADYYYPCMVIRKLSFAPVEVSRVGVTLDLDVYDFDIPEDEE